MRGGEGIKGEEEEGVSTFSLIKTMAFKPQHWRAGVRNYVFAAETGGLVCF